MGRNEQNKTSKKTAFVKQSETVAHLHNTNVSSKGITLKPPVAYHSLGSKYLFLEHLQGRSGNPIYVLCFNNFLRLIIHTYKDLRPYLCPMCVTCPITRSPRPWFVLFDYEVPLCCFPPVSCAWGLLSFSDLCVYSFHEIWKNFIHHLFTHLFCSPLFAGSPITCTFGHLKLSHRTDTLFIFWKILFLCLISHGLH